jgi:integrase
MSDVKFYLNSAKANQATAINLVFCYSGHRLKLSTGLVIDSKFWNVEKQRAKEVMACQEASFVNEQLEHLRKLILDINRKYVQQQIIPDVDSFKESIASEGQDIVERRYSKTFWEYYDEFVLSKKKEKIRDIMGYKKTLPKHLKIVEEQIGRKLTFEAIKRREGGFVEIWDDYMMNFAPNNAGDPGFSSNTVGKHHKYLKTFLNWCFDRDYCRRFSLRHLPTLMEDIEAVYLTEKELFALEGLEDINERESIVRDLFLIGCETGLRYSDYSRLASGVFDNNCLIISPLKTQRRPGDNRVIIPLSGRFKDICEKYDYQLPFFPKNQVTVFNKIIRSLCKEAKITSSKLLVKQSKGEYYEVTKAKWEMVSSHTCRRTFCTLKFLKGMPSIAIMKFSGHKSERNFMKYLKLDAEITAKEYKGYF